tara:strand:- start:6954 stop:7691 length:738 start_codon:yes stop_codon:yes gene_type:complete
MSDQKQIENAALQITKIIETAKEQLIDDLYVLGREIGKNKEFIQTINNLDVSKLLNEKIKKATDVYTISHRKVLEETIQFADIDVSVLTSFIELNQEVFTQSIVRTTAAHIKNEVAKGVLSGLDPKAILDNVTSASISTSQMETLVNTTLNTYSRTISNTMMNTAPKNTKYAYVGAIDDKTRDICLQMSAAGEMTLSEIESNFGSSVLTDGGGFNCRHKWEFVSEEGSSFHKPKEAQRRLEDAKK